MIFTKISIKGAFIIDIEKLEDERGFFVRSWDQKLFKKFGLNYKLVQCSFSFTKKKGIIRGLHYQTEPKEEAKVIRCTKGKIFDVIIDLRTKSKTYKKWFSIELSADNYKMLYVPGGVAHGFQTLEDNTEVFYQMSQFYMPKYARGVKWNDKAFDIKWPLTPTLMSKKDRLFPDFGE